MLTAGENIGVGSHELIGDAAAIAAAAERAGAQGFIGRLPAGYDTMLGREFLGGCSPGRVSPARGDDLTHRRASNCRRDRASSRKSKGDADAQVPHCRRADDRRRPRRRQRSECRRRQFRRRATSSGGSRSAHHRAARRLLRHRSRLCRRPRRPGRRTCLGRTPASAVGSTAPSGAGRSRSGATTARSSPGTFTGGSFELTSAAPGCGRQHVHALGNLVVERRERR